VVIDGIVKNTKIRYAFDLSHNFLKNIAYLTSSAAAEDIL
jgi:hypothetical protein